MPTMITMPKLSPTMKEGTLVKWHKREGDEIKEGEVLFEVATDKAILEYPLLDGGLLGKILVQEGETALVNQPVALLLHSQEESSSLSREVIDHGSASDDSARSRPIVSSKHPSLLPPEDSFLNRCKASPLAKRIAKDQGIDLATIEGSGPNGRIMSRDLPSCSKGSQLFSTHTLSSTTTRFAEESLSPMRKALIKNVEQSKRTIPHFYLQAEVEVTQLVCLRQQLKDQGYKITINDLLVRATALALQKHPGINSGFDAENDKILRFQTIDISIAMRVEGGLFAPIVWQANLKEIQNLSQEIKQLVILAQRGKLRPDQYLGGSFTISNLGMFHVHHFQAIINPPQGAILAASTIRDTPLIRLGQVGCGKVLMLSLSCDHRVIDGADAAQFLATLEEYLSMPAFLLLSSDFQENSSSLSS